MRLNDLRRWIHSTVCVGLLTDPLHVDASRWVVPPETFHESLEPNITRMYMSACCWRGLMVSNHDITLRATFITINNHPNKDVFPLKDTNTGNDEWRRVYRAACFIHSWLFYKTYQKNLCLNRWLLWWMSTWWRVNGGFGRHSLGGLKGETVFHCCVDRQENRKRSSLLTHVQ